MDQTEGPGFVDPEPAGAAGEEQRTLQEVVADVSVRHHGEELDVVRTALADGLAAAGFDPQPPKWMDDTAAELAAGRHVVTDRRLGAGTGTGPVDDGGDEGAPAEAVTPGGR